MTNKKLKRAALYARFSSASQNETSIDGQKNAIIKYAKDNDYVIVQEYIDRAKSAWKNPEKRIKFQQMMEDAEEGKFDALLVYQRDRFFRNMAKASEYQEALNSFGVDVISVMEPIASGSSGFLNQGMIDMFAEYYSMQLSEKVIRGCREVASKGLVMGHPPFGFKKGPNQSIVEDPKTASIVQEIFERYAIDGESRASIVRDLKDRGVLTSYGNPVNDNQLCRILKNERYTGVYIYKDIRVEGAVPKLISKEVFDLAQERLMKNNKGGKGTYKTEEYLLTGKLFCGICGNAITADAGTSKTGKMYYYYKCTGAKGRRNDIECPLPAIRKELLEEKVAKKCYSLLTDDNIRAIAEATAKLCEEDDAKTEVRRIKKEIADRKEKIGNLLSVIEEGKAPESITDKIEEREKEIEGLTKALSIAESKLNTTSVDEMEYFLTHVKCGELDSFSQRRTFINAAVDKIYLYEDHYTIFFKVGKSISVDVDYEDVQKKNNR